MRFSQQAQYAICGMFDLAYNGESLPVQVRVIGDRQRIPARYLEQIFQRLRKAELVRGKRGPGGGYVLARPASAITLRHIVEAVEGPLAEGLASGAPTPTPASTTSEARLPGGRRRRDSVDCAPLRRGSPHS
jgi:Rrf2 family iron-sulfur cluster assembly transcriptional regulator